MCGRRVRMICAAFACVVAFAGWADSLDEIRRTSGTVTTIEASFIQKRESSLLAAPAVARGRFCFRAPRSLRWEYHSPSHSVLLVHDGKERRFVRKEGRWERDRSTAAQSMRFVLKEITLWMKGDFTSNPSFTPALKPGRIISLTPARESMARYVAGIELRLSSKPGVISSVTVHENASSYTVITFTDVVLNRTIEDDVFTEP